MQNMEQMSEVVKWDKLRAILIEQACACAVSCQPDMP